MLDDTQSKPDSSNIMWLRKKIKLLKISIIIPVIKLDILYVPKVTKKLA